MLQPKKPVKVMEKKTTVKVTPKKPKDFISKVKKGLSSLTMKDVKDSAETALNLSTLGGYGVAKKKVKELTGLKSGGTMKKAKSGLGMKSVKSGYDNNSGVTRADFVAIGKGTAKSGKKMQYGGKAASMVPMKMGGAVKKAQDGYTGEPGLLERAGPMVKSKTKVRSPDGNYVTKKVTSSKPNSKKSTTKTRRTLQGFISGAPRVNAMKAGGKMAKCKYGCK
jgi:hypothetical protein